jgi:hypothetical protein
MADDRIELKLEIDGEEQMDDLAAAAILAAGKLEKVAVAATSVEKAVKQQAAATAELEHETYDLADAYEVLGVESTSVFTSAQQQSAAFRAEAAAMGTVEVAAAKASKSVRKLADDKDKATKASGNLGRGLLEASRGLEDLQYGFAGVVNNIPVMVERFGGSAGLAAAISLVAIGINIAIPRVKALWEAFEEMSGKIKEPTSAIETLTKRIDEIKEKKILLAVDRKELDEAEKQVKRLKQLQAEYEANARHQTVDEVAAGKETQTQLEEAGLPEIQEKLKRKYLRDQTAQSEQGGALGRAHADQAAAEESIRKGLEQREEGKRTGQVAMEDVGNRAVVEGEQAIKVAQERAQKIHENIMAAAEAHAVGLIHDLREGHAEVQTKARGNISRELADVGEGPLAGQIAGTTPETIDQIRAKREATTKAAQDRIAERKKERDEAQRRALERTVDSGELAPVPGAAPAAPAAAPRIHGIEGGIALDVPAPIRATDQAAAAGPSPAVVTPNLIADLTKALIAEAEAAHMLPGAMLDHVRDGIVAALTRTNPGVDAAKIQAQAAKLADKAIDDKKRADAAADKKDDATEKKHDVAEAKLTKLEAEKIDKSVGKQRTLEYEGGLNANQVAIDQGATVARNARQERQLQRTQTPYALPPEELARRQREQLEREFRQRGAAPAAAKEAAAKIAGRGDEDLARRSAATMATGVGISQGLASVQRDLITEWQRMTGELADLQREIKNQKSRMRTQQKRAQN